MAQMTGPVRLQKFLAEAGVAARRAAEDLVLEGRVTVNGHRIEGLPFFVDPQRDEVRVDGKRVRPVPKIYLLLNKPKGVVSTNYDPSGRKRVTDLVAAVGCRVFPVGRLEAESDGLMLLTNDGDLAQNLTHPRYGVAKTYRAEVRGQIADEDLRALRGGMWFSEGRAAGARVAVLFRSRQLTVLEVAVRGGVNRQVPRMLARLGYKVKRLTLVHIGKLTTKGMRSGEYRHLKPQEVKYLKKLAERPEPEVTEQAPSRPDVRRQGRRNVRQATHGDRSRRRGRVDRAAEPGSRRAIGPGPRRRKA